MIDDCEEWMPLRQAIVQVAEAYSKYMHCDLAAALGEAQSAILRRLELEVAKSQASKWILTFHNTTEQPPWRQDQREGLELPSAFWGIYRDADTLVANDWVSGEYCFSREEGEHCPRVFGLAFGVEVTRKGLPLISDNLLSGSDTNPNLHSVQHRMGEERRGARRKWDWEGALCAIIADANNDPDGLPEGYGAQAEIGRRLAEWFRNNQNGEPVPSEIGARSARILQTIDGHRK